MKIIKRNGCRGCIDSVKIINAVSKANDEVIEDDKLSSEEIEQIAEYVKQVGRGMTRCLSVEEIQDIVEDEIMKRAKFALARKYITYRYKRDLVRKSNSTDAQILSLLECNNEEVKQENSNKNPTVNSVQRDYMAGELVRISQRDSFFQRI